MLCLLQAIPPNAAFTQHNAQYIRASPANCGLRQESKSKKTVSVSDFSGRMEEGMCDITLSNRLCRASAAI